MKTKSPLVSKIISLFSRGRFWVHKKYSHLVFKMRPKHLASGFTYKPLRTVKISTRNCDISRNLQSLLSSPSPSFSPLFRFQSVFKNKILKHLKPLLSFRSKFTHAPVSHLLKKVWDGAGFLARQCLKPSASGGAGRHLFLRGFVERPPANAWHWRAGHGLKDPWNFTSPIFSYLRLVFLTLLFIIILSANVLVFTKGVSAEKGYFPLKAFIISSFLKNVDQNTESIIHNPQTAGLALNSKIKPRASSSVKQTSESHPSSEIVLGDSISKIVSNASSDNINSQNVAANGVSSTQDVSLFGGAYFSSGIKVKELAEFEKSAEIAERLTVGTRALFQGDAEVQQDLTVNGYATVNQDLTVGTKDLHVDTTTDRVGIGTKHPQRKLDVAGDVKVGKELLVIEDAHLYDTLTVDGWTKMAGILQANGGIEIDGDKFIIDGKRGDVETEGTMRVHGQAWLNSNVSLGNDSSDTLETNARVGSHFIPKTTNTYNLGSSSLSWKNIYTQSILTSGNITFSGLTIQGPVIAGGGGLLSSEAQLAIARGGTNSTATPTAGAIAYGTGSAYTFNSAGSAGQALLSGGTGAPTWTTGTLSLASNFALGGTGGLTLSSGGATTATIPTGTITLADLSTTQPFTGTKTFNDINIADTDISLTGATTTFTATGALTLTAGGALALNSGGTNQNITLTPAGTGYTLLNGNVGIGTTNPTQNLEVASTIKTNDFITKGPIHDVRAYGATGDGTTDDSSAISSAITASSNSTVFFPAGTYKVSSDITVSSNVAIRFDNGAKLSIDSGKTVTINGKLEAGLSQIFSGSGTVSIAKGSVEYLLPQWWGAVGDGANDDTAAIQAALTCAELKTKHVFLPPGIYKTTSALTLNYGTWLQGAGKSDVTTIKVTGGGDGIDVHRIVNAAIYEGAKVSDLRIYSTITPVVGVGIKIAEDRSVDIENVWVGSWYPESSTYGYGFDKGIEIITQPAYHTNISRTAIFRCNYGVYINGGCNEARVLDGEIWYCGYGVYVGQVQTVRIINNSIEQFVTAGVYVDCTEPIVMNNRFEGAAGSQPVILGTHCDRAHIENSTNVTGMGNSNSVLNNSAYEYQRINESTYPIGNHNVGTGLAGLISSDFYNYNAKDVTIESIPGDLKLKARAIGKSIELQSVVESDSHFITPNGGFGDQVANYFLFSEAFSVANWYDWGTGTKTVTDNAAVAPNGTLTASKIVVSAGNGIYAYSSDTSHSAGDVYVFSVWIRSDIAHHGVLYLRRDSTTIHSLDVAIGTEWKRFTISAAINASATSVTAIIVPGALYPTYLWSAQITKGTSITGTDNSGTNNKTTKLIDTTKNFIASGIDIGGMVEVGTGGLAMGKVTSINSTISFNTGTGTQPAVGTTITGGTSTATGTVVEVVITSGTFAGGDAAGYIEINTVMGTFQAETITWTGGSVNATAYYLNDVLVFSGGLQIGYGSKVDFDNGDTYYACSSKAIAPKPYIKTAGSAVVGSTAAVLSGPNIYASGTMSALQGFVHKVDVVNPLNSHRTIYPGTEIAVYNPGQALNITLSTTGVLAGHVCEVVNLSTTYSLWMVGPQISLAPGETGSFLYTGSAWTTMWIGQSYLQKASNVSFKTVNGAVYALTYASTITVYMTWGDVFTLTTTGDCTINAHATYYGTAGQKITFIITDDGTGGHVVTFGTKFKPSGTLTGTASKTATVSFVFDGTNWYEVSRTTGL